MRPRPEPGALRPVSLMGETGLRIDAEAFLDLLAPAFAAWEAQLRHLSGFGRSCPQRLAGPRGAAGQRR
jgi:hypothetical protein